MALEDFIGTWTVETVAANHPAQGPGGSVTIARPALTSEVSVTFVDGTSGQTTVVEGNYQKETDSIEALTPQPDPREVYISRYATADHGYRAVYGLTLRDGDVTVWGASVPDPPASNPQREPVGPSPFDGNYTVRTDGDLGIPRDSQLVISVDATQLAITRPADPNILFGQPLTVDRLTDSVQGDVDGLLRVWSYAARSAGNNYIYGLSIDFTESEAALGSLEYPEQAGACGAEEEPPP